MSGVKENMSSYSAARRAVTKKYLLKRLNFIARKGVARSRVIRALWKGSM